jgi:uncharacterized protein YdeI (YjbR/CyaY-like superfamily)
MKTFKSAQQFRQWLQKNHKSKSELVVRFFKKGFSNYEFSSQEAMDQALCFGWTGVVIKSLDETSYTLKFVKRRPKSAWSFGSIKRFKDLQKRKLMRAAGLKAFNERNKSESQETLPEFPKKYLRLFMKNKIAWEFFQKQTPGYKKYMTWWVIQAKQEITQIKRLNMLIQDSSEGTKLKRIVEAQKKYVKTYEPGNTPIEAAKNIGPVLGAELRSLGITKMEELQNIGWERAFQRLTELYPHRVNLNALMAIVGASENQSVRKLDPQLKSEAKSFLRELRIR